SASAGIGSSNPAPRLTDGFPGPGADGARTDTNARTVTNEASGPTGEAPVATNEAINQGCEARRAGADPVSCPLPLPDEPVLADRGPAGGIADGPPITPASCETPLGELP